MGLLAGTLEKEDYQAIQDKKSRLRLQRSLDILLKMRVIRHVEFPEDSAIPKSVQDDILVLNTRPYFEKPVPDASQKAEEVLTSVAHESWIEHCILMLTAEMSGIRYQLLQGFYRDYIACLAM